MSTDRELLELAAKAAGLTIAWDARGAYIVAEGVSGAGDVWNPLTDDGDALRLAVKLGIDIHFDHGSFFVSALDAMGREHDEQATMGYSREEATRRAIVRAAAAIGKAQP